MASYSNVPAIKASVSYNQTVPANGTNTIINPNSKQCAEITYFYVKNNGSGSVEILINDVVVKTITTGPSGIFENLALMKIGPDSTLKVKNVIGSGASAEVKAFGVIYENGL